jgi:hypothetical protein
MPTTSRAFLPAVPTSAKRRRRRSTASPRRVESRPRASITRTLDSERCVVLARGPSLPAGTTSRETASNRPIAAAAGRCPPFTIEVTTEAGSLCQREFSCRAGSSGHADPEVSRVVSPDAP